MKISYAQNFEDVMLWRALGHVVGGFYLDIGAQDPVVDSVSRVFYECGWRGVHVEPTPAYAQALRQARPDEPVLQMAVGTGNTLIPFYEFPNSGISTGDRPLAERHDAAGYVNCRIDVPCVRLGDLLNRYDDRDIHWMKVDVEGMEKSVLESWHPSAVRPWVVVIESVVPMARELAHGEWEQIILDLGYRFCYFDGLNRFYVFREQASLADAFRVPPNVFDEFALSGTASHNFCARLNETIEQSRLEIERLKARQAGLEQRLETPPRDTAAHALIDDLQGQVAERTTQAERALRETTVQSRQVSSTLAYLKQSKSETLRLMRLFAMNDRAYIVLADAARAEVAHLQRRLAESDREKNELKVQREVLFARELAEKEQRYEAKLSDAEEAARLAIASLRAEYDEHLESARRQQKAMFEQSIAERERIFNAALEAKSGQLEKLHADLNAACDDFQSFRAALSQRLALAERDLQVLGSGPLGRMLKLFGWTPPSLPTVDMEPARTPPLPASSRT